MDIRLGRAPVARTAAVVIDARCIRIDRIVQVEGRTWGYKRPHPASLCKHGLMLIERTR